jgi:hypothetical protein
MPLCSSWIHGVSVQLAATDSPVVGPDQNPALFLGNNATDPTVTNPAVAYCAKRFHREKDTAETFYFAIPIPTVVLGTRANLVRVFLMYDFDSGAAIREVAIFDGPNELSRTEVSRIACGPGYDGVPDPTHDLEEGVNVFPISGTPMVYWGICAVVSVRFTQNATIRFTAAGADFDVH